MRQTKERSRDGCLPCLQKRKKCDELKPICTRCSQGSNHCIWRSSVPKPKPKSRASTISFLPKNHSCLDIIPNGSYDTTISEAAPILESGNVQLVQNDNTYRLTLDPKVDDRTSLTGSDYILNRALHSNPRLLYEPGRVHLAPQILSTRNCEGLEGSASNIYRPECIGRNNTADFLDEDEVEVTKTPEWIPEALESFGPYMPYTDRVSWLSALNSYFMFSARYVYESSNLLEATRTLSANYGWVNSARLGLLGTAVLFHSYTDPLAPQSFLWEQSRRLIDAATTSIQHEMTQPGMPLSAKFAGISVVLVYHYYAGDLNAYVRCIDAAVPTVKELAGPNPVEFHRLCGAETIDIRSFVWCDIFTAIAGSRPTRLMYDCNAEILLRKNQEGPNPTDASMDAGLEWMCGLPDALLMLVIQITNLRHSSLPRTERLIHASKIEKALRDWTVWPSKTPNSMMRVQRMGAQEIWRSFAILYLYQAVHQAPPSQEAVRQSVNQIFKLGSVLRPGHNPDCLLTVPYFVAGTFAVSAKHRQFFKSRLLCCGIGAYGQKLAKALEELWQKSLVTGKHNDWTSNSSPFVIFS